MIQETGPNHPTSLYIYTDQNSYEPLARIDTDGNYEQHIRYFHTDLNGAPEELTDANGKILWECSFQLWGKRIHEIEHEPIEQNLRYQGQYLDRETGLHYNTFRYYDPDIGRFTQPDPIGLLGGLNLYQYAPNGLTWIDPWGLSAGCGSDSQKLAKPGQDLYVGTYSKSRAANIKSGLNPTHTPHHAIQNAVSPTTHGKGITINLRKNLHELTWTYRKPIVPGLSNREYLARDIRDLRKILSNAGYNREVINSQLSELIRQNKKVWKDLKP
ncbi:hypothetical protein BHC49_00990 [Snodgrassella alvi]|uniref:RHS protein conserved region domain-containing protein n=2 Tax=Snodgrassella alvi TaxID=1196083 RepID=A0A2N9Y119_9NEIS|nr:hypothetical protein BHC49_00990 [Snodgrassella alvi]